MKIKSFLKLLNKKINKYDKTISNPFEGKPTNITLIWIEDCHYNRRKINN